MRQTTMSSKGSTNRIVQLAVPAIVLSLIVYTCLLIIVDSEQNSTNYVSHLVSTTKDKIKKRFLNELLKFQRRLISTLPAVEIGNDVTRMYTGNSWLHQLDNQTFGIFDKDFTDSVTDHDYQRITLKPNLSSMINASQIITTIYSPYVLENKNLCAEVKNLSVLVIVHTSVNHFERRMSFRSTWTNNTYFLHLGTIRRLFLLGRSKDKRTEKKIEEEFNKYKDILQGDFHDSYRNLTLKGVMAYRWIAERCRNAKIILKTDDDVIVDMFRFFLNIFPKYKNKTRQMICSYRHPGQAPIMREKGKWLVSNDTFRSLRSYPTTHCVGFMVILTNDIIPDLFRSAKITPFFWIDDIYLYGLVPGNVPGIQYNSLKGKWNNLNPSKALECYRNQTKSCDYLVVGARSKKSFTDLWYQILMRFSNT